MKAPRDADGFIRANTRLLSPPLVPEIVLHLAEESLLIWTKTEEELDDIGLPPPFWAFAWAGGQALARYLLDNPRIARARNVLALGSGSGLEAIAAMKAGAASALAADIDPFAETAARLNAKANGVCLDTTTADLLGAPPDARCDLIVVGDLFYERPLADRVMAFIDAAHGNGTDVLVGDPQRSYFPRQRFEQAAAYVVPVTRELEDAEIKRSAVWRLSNRQSG